jgi:hypothetical protein
MFFRNAIYEPMEPITKVLMFGLCFGLGRQFGISSNGEIRFVKSIFISCSRGFGTRNKYNFIPFGGEAVTALHGDAVLRLGFGIN